jgi:hypothetical protein
MIFVLGPPTDARSIGKPQATPLGVSLWDFQTFATPQTLDALVVHIPALTPEHGRDPTIAVAAVL